MATIEAVVEQKSPAPPAVDPNVIIPDHVKKAAASADALHEQFYPKDPGQVAAPAKEDLPQPPQPEPLHTPVEAVQTPVNQPDPAPKPVDQDQDGDTWQHKFLSMQGRWRSSQNMVGQLQEQISQIGDELIRTQAMLETRQQPTAPQTLQSGQDHRKLITEEDRTAYGDELIDLARRAAQETVGPEIEALRSQNNDLRRQVTTSAQKEINEKLTRDVPNWVAINRSPEFKQWLRLQNIYTGRVRQQMLNEAYQAADAPKVLQFFKDFLREGVATGQLPPTPQTEQPQPAPRTAAIPLEALASPGRAKPASGESSVPADQPYFTRLQVQQFYNDVRARRYEGNTAEKNRIEAQIFAAQNTGRIKG